MDTYARGLLEVGQGKVTVTVLSSTDRFQPRHGDRVVFDDRVGDDGLACIKRWRSAVGIEYGVMLHSPLLQMDLSNELDDTLSLLLDRGDGTPLDFVICPDRHVARLLREARPRVPTYWLPHCLPAHATLRVRVTPEPPPLLCWLPLTLPDRDPFYRHKNTYCQLAAVKQATAGLDCEIRLATNFVSDTMRRFAEFLGVPLQETGSMDPADFLEFLDGVGIGLCVSLSESFSYNAVELMLLGIPTLFGPTLDWAWRCPDLVTMCGIEDPGSIERIAQKLYDLMMTPELYGGASALARQTALMAIEKNHTRARRLITQLANAAD